MSVLKGPGGTFGNGRKISLAHDAGTRPCHEKEVRECLPMDLEITEFCRLPPGRPMSLKDEHAPGLGAVIGSCYLVIQLPIQATARAMGPNGRGFISSIQLWGSSPSGAI